MIGIKRSLIMLATGAALVASGPLGASAAPAVSPSTALTAAGDNGVTFVGRRGGGGGHRFHKGGGGGRHYGGGGGGGKHGGYYRGHRGHRGHGGHNNYFYGGLALAAPFLYYGSGYGDYGYGYSNYGYGYGGGNSCYRACRYENGPRYCRYNWEDYC